MGQHEVLEVLGVSNKQTRCTSTHQFFSMGPHWVVIRKISSRTGEQRETRCAQSVWHKSYGILKAEQETKRSQQLFKHLHGVVRGGTEMLRETTSPTLQIHRVCWRADEGRKIETKTLALRSEAPLKGRLWFYHQEFEHRGELIYPMQSHNPDLLTEGLQTESTPTLITWQRKKHFFFWQKCYLF